MDTDRQPSRQDTLRKLRMYLGLLMNLEQALQECGFDVQEAYRFALHEYDRLDQLQASALHDAAVRPIWEESVRTVETELFHRLCETVEQVRMHAPRHPLLPEYLTYRARWKEWRSSLPDPLPPAPVPSSPETGGAGAQPAGDMILGFPVQLLREAHARMAVLPPVNEFAGLFLVFLGGLLHAQAHPEMAASRPATHREANLMDTLRELTLKEALDFALQSDPQSLVRASVRLPEDRSLHLLFMGVAFVQQNPPAPVKDWLRGGKEMEKKLCLYFAMGASAAHLPEARRLVEPLRDRLTDLVSAHIHPDYGPLLATFRT